MFNPKIKHTGQGGLITTISCNKWKKAQILCRKWRFISIKENGGPEISKAIIKSSGIGGSTLFSLCAVSAFECLVISNFLANTSSNCF